MDGKQTEDVHCEVVVVCFEQWQCGDVKDKSLSGWSCILLQAQNAGGNA